MKPEDFPQEIKPFILPNHDGELIYRCLGCGKQYGIEKLLYTCPDCKQVLLIYDLNFEHLKKIPGSIWRKIFDYRKMLTIPALKGIY
ncbi:MAG: threonine synthase, partial [Desulfobacterales bacterium]